VQLAKSGLSDNRPAACAAGRFAFQNSVILSPFGANHCCSCGCLAALRRYGAGEISTALQFSAQNSPLAGKIALERCTACVPRRDVFFYSFKRCHDTAARKIRA